MKKSVKSASTTASTTSISAQVAGELADVDRRLVAGREQQRLPAVVLALDQELRPRPEEPAQDEAQPEQARAARRPAARGPAPSVNWKTNSRSSEKKSSALSVSFDRRSTSRSFHATIQRAAREASRPRPPCAARRDAAAHRRRASARGVSSAMRPAGQDGDAVGDLQLAAEAVRGHERSRRRAALNACRCSSSHFVARWSRPANGSSSSSTRGRAESEAAPAPAGASCRPRTCARARRRVARAPRRPAPRAARSRVGRQPAQRRPEAQVLERGQVLVDVGAVGDQPQDRADRLGLAARSRDRRPSPCRRVGRSSVATIFSSVRLAAPFGPSSATASPAPTVRDTPSRTRVAPKSRTRPTTSMSASCGHRCVEPGRFSPTPPDRSRKRTDEERASRAHPRRTRASRWAEARDAPWRWTRYLSRMARSRAMRSSIGGCVREQLHQRSPAQRVHDEQVRGGRVGVHRAPAWRPSRASRAPWPGPTCARPAARRWRRPGTRATRRPPSARASRRSAPRPP